MTDRIIGAIDDRVVGVLGKQVPGSSLLAIIFVVCWRCVMTNRFYRRWAVWSTT